MIMAHLLHVFRHNAPYFAKDWSYTSFFSPELSASFATVLFIEIFYAQKKITDES